jgi:LppP/LprE lipoprotein
VIIATAPGSAGAHTQRAFFFVNGGYVRTDLPNSSAGIHIAWRSNTTIALAYALYKATEPVCCPTGGSMIVRYEWNGTQLQVLDPIPPVTLRR